jgi:hypothetical protein
MLRGDEVRIATAEINHIPTLRLELPGLLGDCEGRRGSRLADTCREKLGGRAVSSVHGVLPRLS